MKTFLCVLFYFLYCTTIVFSVQHRYNTIRTKNRSMQIMPKQIEKEIECLYKKLYDEIILMKFGKQLPSYRELLQKYDCSRQVLNKTLQKLRDEKVIKVQERVGMFSNLKTTKTHKKIIFAHIDWACEHIKYFGDKLSEYYSNRPNYTFIEMRYAPGPIKTFIEKLKDSNADLILFDMEDFSFDVFECMGELTQKTIFFSSSINIKNINAIDSLPYMTGMLAAQHFINLNHTQIALVLSEPRLFSHRERIYGFLDYLKLYNIKPVIIDCKIKSGFSSAGMTLDFMNKYLAENSVNFTACFALGDTSALMIAEALKNYNIKIPQDVSLLGWGGEYIGNDEKFNLSTISFDFEKTIDVTIKSIEQFFASGKCGIKRIPPILIDKKSTTSNNRKTKLK